MSSSVHFRFKSAREFETLSFEGDFLKVADLKLAIVERKKLNFGEGFDLEISDASTGDVFNDESAFVQKNTSVIVRRIPGLKQGGILSHQEMAAKNERYAEKQAAKPQQRPTASADHNPVLPKTIEGSDEAERIASLVMQSNVQYDQFPPLVRGRHGNRSNNRGRSTGYGAARNSHGHASFQGSGHTSSAYPDRAPKPSSNYVCHRCNRPGHWIDQCPTNGDPAYDRIKVRAPTGIPRSMLRQVDAPESGTGLQDSSGHFVTLQPNEEEFARQTVGLRLSQAAASAVDVKADQNTESNIETAKPSQNGTSDAVPEQGTPRRMDGEGNAQPGASHQGKSNKQTQLGGEHNDNGSSAQAEEKTGKGAADSTKKIDSSKTHLSKHQVPREGSKQNELRNLPIQGKKATSLPRKGQTQPSQRPGISHMLSVPPIPPGFPPLGMPPLPSGIPPIPPHVLMAMAMANRQNGQNSHLPPGMLPSMPLPFTSSTPSISNANTKGVETETQQVVLKEKRTTSHPSSPREVDEKVMYEDKVRRTKVEQTNQKRNSNDANDREDSRFAGRDKTYPSSEMIGFVSHPNNDFSSSRPLRLDRGRVRDAEKASRYGHEAGTRSEHLSGSRETVRVPRPYNRREAHRSPSPPSVVRRNILDRQRGSPGRRERRNRAAKSLSSLSPKRRVSENGRDDRHARPNYREARAMRNSSFEYREDNLREDFTGSSTSRRDYHERRALSPSRRSRHEMNGTMPTDISRHRSRSPEGRTRFSPSRRLRGNSPRGRYGQENRDTRLRRGGSTERRRRSATPPRSAGPSTLAQEDTHGRRYQTLDRAEKGREFGSRRSPDRDRARFKVNDRTRQKMPESEPDDRDRIEHIRDANPFPEESRQPGLIVSDGSSPSSVDEGRRYAAAASSSQRKREFDTNEDIDHRDFKKQRRPRGEERNSYHRDDIRDRRISVHHRLGRQVDSRRRRDQRRSVHDRLG